MSKMGGPGWDSIRQCHNDALEKCLRDVVTTCENSHIRVAKVLRLSMDLVKNLLRKIHSLKVVLLIRDPRGIMTSRLSFMNAFKRHVKKAAFSLCKKLFEDLTLFKRLQEIYPSRLRIVKYESLTDEPFLTMKRLYGFIGYDYTQIDMDFLYNMTHGKNRIFFKTNSSKHVSRWSTRISPYLYQYLQEHCLETYRLLNYPRYRNFKALKKSSFGS